MSMTGRIGVGLCVLAVAFSSLRADQPAPADKQDRKALEATLYKTLRDVINKGVEVYRNGDHAGCYRIFEGALLTAKPLLDNRPELQKSIDKAFAAAENDPVMYRRAFTLRAALDKVRADINPNPKKDKLPAPHLDDKKPETKPEDKKLEEKKLEEKKLDDKKPDPDQKNDDKEKLPMPKTEKDN